MGNCNFKAEQEKDSITRKQQIIILVSNHKSSPQIY